MRTGLRSELGEKYFQKAMKESPENPLGYILKNDFNGVYKEEVDNSFNEFKLHPYKNSFCQETMTELGVIYLHKNDGRDISRIVSGE